MCRTGCPTRDCESYGACCRNANTGLLHYVPGKGFYSTQQKKADQELDAYRQARNEGLQPAGTRMHQVRAAYDEAEKG